MQSCNPVTVFTTKGLDSSMPSHILIKALSCTHVLMHPFERTHSKALRVLHATMYPCDCDTHIKALKAPDLHHVVSSFGDNTHDPQGLLHLGAVYARFFSVL